MSMFSSAVIGSGLDAAPPDGEPDNYRPELADAENAAGDSYYDWTAVWNGVDPDTGLPNGTNFLVEARLAPTTDPGEPPPLLPNTQIIVFGSERNNGIDILEPASQARLWRALIRHDIFPAPYFGAGRQVREALQEILRKYNPAFDIDRLVLPPRRP